MERQTVLAPGRPSSGRVDERDPEPRQPAPTVRKRVRSSKGCGTCKRRKVRCDERRPACSRCTAGGLTCPGYPTGILKWRTKHEVHQIATPAANTDSTPRHEPQVRTFTVPPRHGHQSVPAAWDSPAALHTSPPELGPTLGHDEASETASEISPSTPNSFSTCLFQPLSHHGVAARLVEPTDVPGLDTGQINPPDSPTSATILPLIPFTPQPWAATAPTRLALDPVPGSMLLHIPTVLVDYYFQKVCRDCSTFDSSFNPFRSMVSNMLSNSELVNDAISSLAASKLADDMPRMKIVGIEAQGKALQHVKRAFSTVDALHQVSDEVLTALLLLGMTTSWHVREDIGLEYLLLARRVITAKAESDDASIKANLDFFQNAHKYWTMIVSMVSGAADISECRVGDSSPTATAPMPSPTVSRKIMPHPWTGISPVSQQLFGQILQLHRRTRDQTSRRKEFGYSRASIAEIQLVIDSAEQLEKECWAVSVPSVRELEETGDPDTPRLHHVLTARCYLLCALLHVYLTFPDVLEARIGVETGEDGASNNANTSSDDSSDISFSLSKDYLWPHRTNADTHDMWIRDIGLRIVENLEMIDVRSSTRVVHPPILLSVSSALTLSRLNQRQADLNQRQPDQGGEHPSPPRYADSSGPADRPSGDLELYFRIRECRAFIVSRLETMHAAMRFHAIDNILKIVREVWRRADAGAADVHWMDVMHEIKCVTIFG